VRAHQKQVPSKQLRASPREVRLQPGLHPDLSQPSCLQSLRNRRLLRQYQMHIPLWPVLKVQLPNQEMRVREGVWLQWSSLLDLQRTIFPEGHVLCRLPSRFLLQLSQGRLRVPLRLSDDQRQMLLIVLRRSGLRPNSQEMCL